MFMSAITFNVSVHNQCYYLGTGTAIHNIACHKS